MAFGFNRTLGVVLTADTKRLERGLDRAERKINSFGKATQGRQGGLGALMSMRGGGIAAGVGAAAVGLHKIAQASKDAELAQAKLRVALQNAGLSYSVYAQRIDEAIQKQSQLSGFDDELLTDSFANMLRSTRSVTEALKLNALAADIARTRGIDLAGAQSLVARVYAGSYQGVKRLGIQFETVTAAQDALRASGKQYTAQQMKQAKALDAIASRQRAIATLQRAFAGQAKAYGDSAAGSTDKFRVALENLMETAGPGLASMEKSFVDLGTSIVTAFDSGLKKSQGFFDKILELEERLIPFIKVMKDAGVALTPEAAAAAEAIVAPGEGRNPGGGGKAGKGGRSAPTMTKEQTLLLAQLRAGLSADLGDDLKAASDLAAFYKSQAAGAKNAKERFAATQAMIQAQQDIADIQQQMADKTRADAQKQKDRLREAAENARKAAKELADRLAESADKFKDALLRALDRKQDNLDTSRAVADAKKALAQARVLGGPETIKLAKRNLEDAYLARQRFLAENANVTANKGGGYSIVINGMTVNGVQDVKQFLAQLQRLAKQNAAPTTGRYPAHGHGGR